MSMDLKIRIISRLNETQQFLLYQEAINLNVKNFQVAAWEHQYIAPKAEFDVILPMTIAVGGRSDLGRGSMTTKQLPADYNTSWEIFDNDKALDICKSSIVPPDQNTIDIHNKCDVRRYAVVTKDGKPLFACEVRPEFKVNFSISPKLYIALSDLEIQEEFFNAATLSREPYEIDYEGQSHVTIYLDDDLGSGKVTISHNFDNF